MAQATIVNTTNQPLKFFEENGEPTTMALPSDMVPSFKRMVATQNNTHHNIIVKLTGGIGDNICAEPALRFALKNFKRSKISIAYNHPEIFQHLKLQDVWDTKVMTPDYNRYYGFISFFENGHLANEFIAPPFTHCVDYSTLALWRCQIPHADRCVVLIPTVDQWKIANENIKSNDVVIHPGQTWPSRTLPKDWWDVVLHHLVQNGARPVLIGDVINDGGQIRGTVEVNTEGCLDLRNKLSIMESVAVAQLARVVLTNDSAPLHFAASGRAWVGFLSTVRHPEIITHYRNGGEFGWRMQNFAKGGHWQNFNLDPSSGDNLRMDMVRQSELRSWLPEPREFADWALEKVKLDP